MFETQPPIRPAVSMANSRQKHRAAGCPWQCKLLSTVIYMIFVSSGPALVAAHTASINNIHPSSSKTAPAPAAAAAAAVAQASVHHGRSLKQVGYDPYGIGYYDPYQAGVTPGLINVDLNRETGLHVDVGTVAVDISADKNYYGLGVGNVLGIGAAKDRGWNLQVGGGNIVDVSVTKDAGLGLWLLNGLANIQIGPDGRGWETGHIAAQNVPGQAATAAAAAPGQQVTSVVVDEPAAGAGDSKASASEVHVASDSAAVAAAAVEEPIITEEPINPELTAAAAAAAAAAAGADAAQAPALQTAAARSSAARRSRPRTYVQPRPAVYVQPRPAVVTTEDEGVWAGAAVPGVQYAAQPAAAAAELAAAPAAGSTVDGEAPAYAAAAGYPTQQVLAGAAAAAAAAAPRRACEGGVMVAVAGNKFKCKYRKGARQAALRAQPTGFAAQH